DNLGRAFLMNLYVLFAIGLGAISGRWEPSVSPRALARVVDVRGARAGGQQIAAVRAAFSRENATRSVQRPRILAFARLEAPHTGAATPRAPATNLCPFSRRRFVCCWIGTHHDRSGIDCDFRLEARAGREANDPDRAQDQQPRAPDQRAQRRTAAREDNRVP